MLVVAGMTAMVQAEVTDFSAIENTAIQEGGRKRAFFTFSVESLQTLYGKAVYRGDLGDGTVSKFPAMRMVFDLWANPDAWHNRPLILVSLKELKEAVGLPADRKHFSLSELFANAALKAKIDGVAALQADPAKPKLDRMQTEVRDVTGRLQLAHSLMTGASFTFVPNPLSSEGRWGLPAQAATLYPEKGADITSLAEGMLAAYRTGDNVAFSTGAEQFSTAVAALKPDDYPSAGMMKLETNYGKVHPFSWSWKLLAAAAILLGLTSLKGRSAGYKIAWVLVVAAFLLQIYGFVARILIGGRGPVTNMYESVLWVAFGAILFAMILEAIYKSRLIFVGAMPVAVISLIIADTQSVVLKPSIDPLQAVLRDNFWLSTHVTSITLGYAAFLLSLGVGHLILFKVLFQRPVTAALYNYLYRSLQIGVLLLAIGTILGGIWANYSWGRFWDWDPKETWALIALLGYLALLHGRIAGWWKGFGLAVGSVIGFMSVVMAWYGVNFVLGQGLHSYGFGVGGLEYAVGYVIAEIVFIAIVLLAKGRASKGGAAKIEDEDEVEEEANA